MAKTSKSAQENTRVRTQAQQVADRRAMNRSQREAAEQRRVLTWIGGALGLVLLVLLGGIAYDQLWLPSRPVAAANDTTLTRSDYWDARRTELAQELVQNYQLARLFGDNPEFGQQFANRGPVVNQQVAALSVQPDNPQTISAWQDRQLAQAGAQELGVAVDEGEVAQELVANLGTVFLPAPPITGTDTLTGTDVVTDAPLLAEPTAQPTPDVARAQADIPTIVDAIYEQYTTELELAQQEPELSQDTIRTALFAQFRERLLNDRIRESLVPEDTFEATEEPERVQARQILVAVDVPPDASEDEREVAFADALPDAEALAEDVADGANFADLAAEESDDVGSREQGGDLGFFTSDGTADSGAVYPPAVVEAAFALEPGEISAPIRSPFGWHIIEVTEQTIPEAEQQLRSARNEAYESWLDELRTEAELTTFADIEPTPSPPVPVGDEQEDLPTPAPTFQPGPPTPLPTVEPGAAPETDVEVVPIQPEGEP